MNVKPFCGYRYGAPGVDVSAVVAPPYDQIDGAMQDRLLAMSPHNVVRITLPKDEPDVDRYQAARRVLDAWVGNNVWAAADRAAIYPYQQTYTVGGKTFTRSAFIALGEVSEYAKNVVLPHERTHTGPKKDRMQLLEATGADTGLLFMLVSDPDRAILRATAPTGEPIAEARDLKGEQHRLWRITDDAAIAKIRALMAPKSVIIADGHHRYETAVAYAKNHPSVTHKMMAFCALEAPGLTILPNHRLVHDVASFSLEKLATAARASFDVTPFGGDPTTLKPTPRTIGVVAGGKAMVFRLRDDAARTIAWPSRTSKAWRELSVSILHEGLLKPLLAITDDKLDAKTHVDYTADQAEAVRLARDGRCQAAFLIAPTTGAELSAVVDGGELMPQKSTHFYPKMLDGLVWHRVQGA